jgi:hypothetical protein
MVVYKTKAERVQEAVTLLKKLKELGIHVSDPGYKEAKTLLDEWIKTGEPSEHIFWFARYGRKAEIKLPKRVEQAATLRLFAPVEESIEE